MKHLIIITCEHGGNQIPIFCQKKIQIPKSALQSHHGFDIGALSIAKKLAENTGAKLVTNEISRLIIDFNRSLHHRELFSQYSRIVNSEIKHTLVNNFYKPYRFKVEKLIRENAKVIHLSIHSFTPQLNGKTRNTEIGILYDPARKNESILANQITLGLKKINIKSRKNYPYRGTADGFTTYLRKHFNENHYTGIEIEFNQKLPPLKGNNLKNKNNIITISLETITNIIKFNYSYYSS